MVAGFWHVLLLLFRLCETLSSLTHSRPWCDLWIRIFAILYSPKTTMSLCIPPSHTLQPGFISVCVLLSRNGDVPTKVGTVHWIIIIVHSHSYLFIYHFGVFFVAAHTNLFLHVLLIQPYYHLDRDTRCVLYVRRDTVFETALWELNETGVPVGDPENSNAIGVFCIRRIHITPITHLIHLLCASNGVESGCFARKSKDIALQFISIRWMEESKQFRMRETKIWHKFDCFCTECVTIFTL